MEEEDKIYKKKCSYCGKVIKSLSEQQCNYNFLRHIEACRKKRGASRSRVKFTSWKKPKKMKGGNEDNE